MRLAFLLPVLVFFSLAHNAQTECSPGVTITVFPRVAAPGVPIQVIVTNNSPDPVMLATGCTYSAVYAVEPCCADCTGIPVYRPRMVGDPGFLPPVCGADPITIPPTQSAFTAWNQRDTENNQVPDGDYSFKVDVWTNSGDSSCCVRGTVANPQPAASASPRLGSGINPESLTNDSMPVLGTSWDTTLDCSAHAPGIAGLYLKDRPVNGIVLNMGEVLVLGKRLFRLIQPHSSSAVSNSLAIPNDVSLWGLRAYAQGVCLGAPGPQLSNALDIILGT